ncbi:MAG: YbbR-like domain-containing protein [Bacteroidota bacterium]|nr:YbbR-like domain-containing protein [Bacteroidota bacterium]
MKADNTNREKHIQKFANARLRYQFFVSVVCLIASISFWMLIKLSNDYTLSFNIPLKFVNVPDTRMITGTSDSIVQVTMQAQGYKLILLRYLDKSKPLLIDLSNGKKTLTPDEITSQVQLLPWVRSYSTFLGFVNEIHSIHPEQVSVKMNRVHCKSVPVRLSADITFAPQYLQFDPYLIKPSHVMVFGTRSMIDSIRFAQPELIKARNLSESVVRTVHLNANTLINKPFFLPSRIQVTIPVQKFTEENIEVPISLPGLVPGHTIKLFPDKAVVSCIVAMSDYIRLNPHLFTISAVLNRSDNMYHLMVTNAPEFVRNVKITPEKVEYLIIR